MQIGRSVSADERRINMESPGKKFTDLVEIESIQDTDLTVVRNNTGVKKTPMQKLSDYIKQKFIGWVFNDLPTTDKTIPGAIKELNSALTVRLSDEEFRTNESMYDNPIYARSFVATLIDAPEGDTIELDLSDLPDCTYAWLDLSNSFIYSSYATYPLAYADNLDNSVSAHIDFRSKKAIIQVKGNWETYTAWLVVKYY